MEGYFYLGKILRLFASKGAVLVQLDVDEPENYQNLESVFVQMNGQLIPFFILKLELRHNLRAVIEFQDIDNTEQASILLGCELFLPIEQLPRLTGDRFYYHEIKNYQVIDLNFGETGRVEEVLEYPHQAILRILRGKKEILIPITDEIITAVDRENKIIHVNAPEGLIAMYLE
ncbi:MAG: ribosome maturation factor RimM [Lentimicrobium sp.]|jgi:16S rRNA processing protein RimM|nr:ribosome maturation factor RimM [Lentimicrobium sp.]MDD2526674.1 ribosome maturation factor RimM [Lentimicrobiaceae bacterium]MDD4596858.1 ribosome maturation factor RimM [Lentimicrobiaceae bacterium]MDY0025282.1 ribosome maturation factor RimM [Lentimicrobium sp.]